MGNALREAVDEVVGGEIALMHDAAIAAELVELRREIDRLEHRAAKLVVAVHRRGIADADGQASTPSWVAWRTGQRWVEAKGSLEAGLVCDDLPLVDKAWSQGEISASAARVICEGRDPEHPDVFASMEQTLVEYAAAHYWREVHAVVRHARRCCDALDDREPADRNGVHLSKIQDRWMLSGDLDDLAGNTLSDAINAAAGKPLEGDERSPAKRRADALAEIASFYLGHEDLPVEAGEVPHVSVCLDWTTITSENPAAVASWPTEMVLSTAQLRQMLCDCRVSRIVVGPDGLPLDVGREERTVPRWMRRAINRRDGGCRFPGCGRRPGWCQAHHIRPWELGGSTSLENLILLCPFHHHVVHRTGWIITFDAFTVRVRNHRGELVGQTMNQGLPPPRGEPKR